jgi:hypothetical protein
VSDCASIASRASACFRARSCIHTHPKAHRTVSTIASAATADADCHAAKHATSSSSLVRVCAPCRRFDDSPCQSKQRKVS